MDDERRVLWRRDRQRQCGIGHGDVRDVGNPLDRPTASCGRWRTPDTDWIVGSFAKGWRCRSIRHWPRGIVDRHRCPLSCRGEFPVRFDLAPLDRRQAEHEHGLHGPLANAREYQRGKHAAGDRRQHEQPPRKLDEDQRIDRFPDRRGCRGHHEERARNDEQPPHDHGCRDGKWPPEPRDSRDESGCRQDHPLQAADLQRHLVLGGIPRTCIAPRPVEPPGRIHEMPPVVEGTGRHAPDLDLVELTDRWDRIEGREARAQEESDDDHADTQRRAAMDKR